MNTMHKLSAAILLAMASGSVLAADQSTEIRDLRARLDALERQANVNSAAIIITREEIGQAYKEAPVMVRRTINDAASAAARIDNATYGDDLSGFFKLPNTQSVMRIGGYLKLDAIYDFDPTGNPDQFLVGSLPTDPATPGAGNQFHMHAKQTRINFEIRRPTNDTLGPLRILIENDFFGDEGSTNYRLRHAFAQVNNILGGYTYSTFMDADSLPNTLDFAGPGGAVFLFTPQLRFSKALSEGTNIAFAIERPASEIDYAGSPAAIAAGITAGDNYESTPMPDFIARTRWESTGGHVQVGAVLRDIAYDNGAGNDDSVMGGGASITGVVKTVGSDSLQFGVTGGQGMGHYFSDLNGGSQDAGFDANGELEALKSVGGYVAYQHYWTEQWNSSLVYGNLQVDNSAGQLGDALNKDQYASLNLLWSPANTRLTMGMEVLHGVLELKDGSDRSASRIQFSAQLDLMR